MNPDSQIAPKEIRKGEILDVSKEMPVLLCERVGARVSPNDNPGWTGGTPPSRHSPPTRCATLSITLETFGEIRLGQFEKYIYELKEM